MLSDSFYIYYNWNNKENIINRIYPTAAQIDSANPKEISSYTERLIKNFCI